MQDSSNVECAFDNKHVYKNNISPFEFQKLNNKIYIESYFLVSNLS